MVNSLEQLQGHYPFLFATGQILVVFLVLSLMVAYMVYLERKVVAFIQVRLGPMRVGPWGLLQPIADGLKLMLKEDIVPKAADKWVFLVAPVLTVVPAFVVFSVIPFGDSTIFRITDLNIGVLFVLAVGSTGIFGVILGGWSSNSHYPLLGALRSTAQMVSYEVALGFSIIGVLLVAGSLSMVEIVQQQQSMGVWYFAVQPVAFVLFFICGLAETNRIPFDLPEAETELVGGFHTEYSGFRFSLFFIAEYANMVTISALGVTLFFGGWLRPFPNVAWLGFLDLVPPVAWFVFKVFLFLYVFIWIRGTLPRFRFDQLMRYGWKVFLPVALANVILSAGVILLL
jgi:NADH-quinone oxidoreductase subunit H